MARKGRWFAMAIAAAASSVGVTVVSSSAAATAQHAPAASSAREFFYVTSANGKETVIAHGLFAGGGRDDAHGINDILHFGNGTVTFSHPGSGHTSHQHIDHSTCYASLQITGKYTLTHGTGNYSGISGSGSYKVKVQAILRRTSDGHCDKQRKPKVEADFIKASGPASLP
jgi:hypothetical protein